MSGPVGGQAARSAQERVGELIETLGALDDSTARNCAQQLMKAILDLHGAGLSRMLELVANENAPGGLLERLAQDETVSELLLLHGLHPHDLALRVSQAVNGLRGTLGVHGIRIEISNIDEEAVRLRLAGLWHGKHGSAAQVRSDIETAIFALAPEVAAIEIDNLPDDHVHEMKFVPTRVKQAHLADSGSG